MLFPFHLVITRNQQEQFSQELSAFYRATETQQLLQGHKACTWWSWDLKLTSLTSQSVQMKPMFYHLQVALVRISIFGTKLTWIAICDHQEVTICEHLHCLKVFVVLPAFICFAFSRFSFGLFLKWTSNLSLSLELVTDLLSAPKL